VVRKTSTGAAGSASATGTTTSGTLLQFAVKKNQMQKIKITPSEMEFLAPEFFTSSSYPTPSVSLTSSASSVPIATVRLKHQFSRPALLTFIP